jgi:hypothetical protein
MYLVDLSNNSTIYVFPLTASLAYNITVSMTPMPIPLQNFPLLLNFGGASPTITIDWVITGGPGGAPNNYQNNYTGTAQGDYIQLTQNIGWGSSTSGYELWLPEVSTNPMSPLGVNCFLTQLSVTYPAGQVNAYTCSATFALGTVV